MKNGKMKNLKTGFADSCKSGIKRPVTMANLCVLQSKCSTHEFAILLDHTGDEEVQS